MNSRDLLVVAAALAAASLAPAALSAEETATGLKSRTLIIGNLDARISYLVRHNTDVPEDRNNSDFFTTIGLEYKF